jgi:TatD DNase family protein
MPAIELIDTHVHLDDDRFDCDRDQVMARARAAGINCMIVPATTRKRWQKIQSLTDDYKDVHATCGLHPLFVAQHHEDDLNTLEQQISANACIAIGECGLDRYCLKQLQPSCLNTDTADSDSLFARQQFYFESQLELASTFDLPVIVHARQAVEEVILSIRKSPATRGVVHSFNGSLQQGFRLIELGYKLSFGGAATYPRANKIRRLIKDLPADSILLETDAPDQPGYAQRSREMFPQQDKVGQQNNTWRNEPSFLTEVLQTVATLRGESEESVARQCNDNARQLFRLARGDEDSDSGSDSGRYNASSGAYK